MRDNSASRTNAMVSRSVTPFSRRAIRWRVSRLGGELVSPRAPLEPDGWNENECPGGGSIYGFCLGWTSVRHGWLEDERE